MQQSTMSGEEKPTIVALWSMDEMTTMRVDGWSVFFPPSSSFKKSFLYKEFCFRFFFERALSHRHNSRNL